MSQDLFAAFGDEDSTSVWSKTDDTQQSPLASEEHSTSVWSANRAAGWDQANDAKITTAEDDEDDFGDFEDASTPNVPDSNVQVGVAASHSKAGLKSQQSLTMDAPFSKKATTKTAQNEILSSRPAKQEDVGHHPFAGRMDLLFETGDDEYDAGADELADLATNPEAAMAYSKRIIAEQEAEQFRLNDTVVKTEQSPRAAAGEPKNKQSESKRETESSIYPSAKNPNVLFDADDLSETEDEDDDFDDFENGEENIAAKDSSIDDIQAQQQSSMPAMDLLGLDEVSPATHTYYNAGMPNSERVANVVPRESVAASTPATPAVPQKDDDDFWDDFEAPGQVEAQSTSNRLSSPLSSSKTQQDSQQSSSNQPTVLPPTNVPPPAVLLSIFPSVFAEADEALFNTISKLDLKQKQMLLAHPASHQFLKHYLEHGIALARIITGRKVRWKRDQRLSQSMRIGPAAAGGKGGMKLTGLDKSEVAKEDREVLDVLRLWKAQVGRLRTAVTAASAAPALPKLPSVPEITDQMAVKTLKPNEGGLTAAQPCALCGLKREERVSKVDLEVDDSFGEWWVQGMNMHLSCRNFWDEFEKKLKSR